MKTLNKMLVREIFISLKLSSKMWPVMMSRSYSSIFPNENENESDDNARRNARKLKKWRNDSFTKTDVAIQDSDSETFSTVDTEYKQTSLKSWYRAKQYDYLKWSQRYIEERHQILGNHLAITHFILHRGGKVKKRGDIDYLSSDDLCDLPASFTPNWAIDEIDFSNSEVCYEGLANFRDIKTLRKVSFKGCIHFDDWCLERIVSMCPYIEHLDVSNCKNVTERGIEGLYRSWRLKNLIVTNFGYGPAFELTCLMLEDCMPDLKIEIIKDARM